MGIEPFPPMFDENGQGLGYQLLSSAAQQSSLQLTYQNMTYARAKKELENHRVDIIGLVPKGLETESFYRYAAELDWAFDTNLDIYSYNPLYLNLDKVPDNSIGTLLGNATFFANILNIPERKFIEVASLPQLAKMLAKRRVKAAVFERVAMMSKLSEVIQAPIHYRRLIGIPATLAVANNQRGLALKEQLDSILTTNKVAFDYLQHRYNKLPEKGVMQP